MRRVYKYACMRLFVHDKIGDKKKKEIEENNSVKLSNMYDTVIFYV